MNQREPIMRNRRAFTRCAARNALGVCLYWVVIEPIQAITFDPEVVATNYSRIHGESRPLLAYYTRSDHEAVHLGVMEAVKADTPPRLEELVTLSVRRSDYARCDVWLSSSKRPLTCLLLRENRFGNIIEHSIVPYSVAGLDGTPQIFSSHRLTVTRKSDGRATTEDFIAALKLKTALRSKLETNSPIRQAGLPEIGVTTVDNVSLEDSPEGAIVRGILNGEWRFTLLLRVDEVSQRVSPATLLIDPLSRRDGR